MTPETTVLVLVDVQVKLAAVMPDRETLIDRLVRLARGARILGVPILATEQIPAKLGPTVAELSPELGGPAIVKSSFSCMGCDEFRRQLDLLGRGHVLLAGIEAHVCVYQTAADLLETNHYGVDVVADAVASRDAEHRRVALDRMAAMGARLTVTEMALFEMLRSAEHRAFREILRLVK